MMPSLSCLTFLMPLNIFALLYTVANAKDSESWKTGLIFLLDTFHGCALGFFMSCLYN
jgi:hypothetical protein